MFKNLARLFSVPLPHFFIYLTKFCVARKPQPRDHNRFLHTESRTHSSRLLLFIFLSALSAFLTLKPRVVTADTPERIIFYYGGQKFSANITFPTVAKK